MPDDVCVYSELRQIPVKDLIPESRLAVVAGDFFVSDPVVYDGDDVYEVDLTPENRINRQACRRFSNVETWMLPDTEYLFLRCIAGADANDVENFVAYAEKNHWLGGKNISLNLDVSKTIFNRQTKLVLHNSKPQKSLDYHVTNASQPFKKTNFILEDWPYVNLNEPIISKGTDDELAPWMRSRNKQFNTCRPIKFDKLQQSVFLMHEYALLQENWILQQTLQQKQHQQQSHQPHQQQYNQHLHHQLYQQQQQQQQRQYQQQQQHQQRQLNQLQSQQRAFLFPSPSSRQQVFMYGQQQMIPPFLYNITFQPGNVYQRFSTPFLQPTHYRPINKDSLSATTTTQK
ncbi:alpha-protein kinase 1-like [Rhopalosiphum padi]|uniref:alpha-protein kinase 1-like n=1 Tax=Rhopalosiphum padi TaxID=40932 RepID=UPI00298EBFC0|nr:alpha-protein kinase 1-like [Rhopalosiphum padi]